MSSRMHPTRHRAARVLVWLAATLATMAAARAATLAPAVLARIHAATFEVVAAKPTRDPLTYARPLPMDLLPYAQRTDKYHSIGTAFAIGPNRFLTAAHVLLTSRDSLWGPLSLRDAAGHVYAIDRVEKFALRRDFAVVSLVAPPGGAATLPVDPRPAINGAVYAVGNALGAGVVARAGLLTSQTPEPQSGAWNWLRFSAAVSPGNSGGPLLDGDGQVIGLVLGQSPEANLNFALPISEVVNAPAHLARLHRRMPFGFALTDATTTATLKAQFGLPLSLADFDATLQRLDHAWEDQQLKALFAQYADELFPAGAGSAFMLHAASGMDELPELLTRDSTGRWRPADSKGPVFPLEDNGQIAFALAAHTVLFHLRRPDSVSATALAADPKMLMDLFLESGVIRRKVASEKIKVTSLGNATLDEPWTDRWQRPWQVLAWPVPYLDGDVVLAVLPVPDGYVGMQRTVRTFDLHETLNQLEAMTGFVNVAYHGTLSQWQDYLGHAATLPAALRRIQIVSDDHTDFRYSSPRVSFEVTPAVQDIASDSELTLGFGFSGSGNSVVWGVNDIRLVAAKGEHDSVNIERHLQPSPDLGDAFEVPWRNVLARQYPWNGVIRSDNDVTKVTRVVGPAARSPQPALLYTAFVGRDGAQSQASMDARMTAVLRHLVVHEAGGASATAGPD